MLRHLKIDPLGADLIGLVLKMVDTMTMLMVNIHELKSQLSAILRKLAPGEVALVCKRNVPIAELRRIEAVGEGPRELGKCAGEFTVPDTFFDPLPDDVLDAFEGRSS